MCHPLRCDAATPTSGTTDSFTDEGMTFSMRIDDRHPSGAGIDETDDAVKEMKPAAARLAAIAGEHQQGPNDCARSGSHRLEGRQITTTPSLYSNRQLVTDSRNKCPFRVFVFSWQIQGYAARGIQKQAGFHEVAGAGRQGRVRQSARAVLLRSETSREPSAL